MGGSLRAHGGQVVRRASSAAIKAAAYELAEPRAFAGMRGTQKWGVYRGVIRGEKPEGYCVTTGSVGGERAACGQPPISYRWRVGAATGLAGSRLLEGGEAVILQKTRGAGRSGERPGQQSGRAHIGGAVGVAVSRRPVAQTAKCTGAARLGGRQRREQHPAHSAPPGKAQGDAVACPPGHGRRRQQPKQPMPINQARRTWAGGGAANSLSSSLGALGWASLKVVFT